MKLQHPEVRYEVTDLCNATCIMCPRDKHSRKHGIMNQESFESSIDEVIKLGCKRICLTGFGEPFLDRNLEKKIAYANVRGLKTHLITNGSVLTARRRKAVIKAGLDELRISFYGMWPESYNAVMKGLDFNTTQKRILDFLKERTQTKVHLSYLVLPENEKE
ncbi:MAG: radical SAM protein, partial [Gammaproteobacteria bacterium]|nr:radical SAM protein [Gammaproteobacteria bacterium]